MDNTAMLIQAAIEAREEAYAPYSHFQVGAAVCTVAGRVYTGCNIENASFGATVCAERVAVLKAVSEGAREIEAIAIVYADDVFARPCGICRQVLAEFNPRMRVICANTKGEYEERGLDELLPAQFGGEQLAGEPEA
jgi:cytidine deaminase